MTRIAILTALVAVLAGHAQAEAPGAESGMLRFPDVGATHIVFVYANDLWLVPREGGIAQPLASPAGSERNPKFSPDGMQIAFMGNYDGGNDLYTIPVAGGIPERVTFHPSTEIFSDWAASDRLVFSTSAFSGIGRAPLLMTVAPSGGLPEALPVPYGMNGTLNADGRWLAYTPNSRDNRNWKRYRGGMATDIWLFNVQSKESQRLTDWEGTDSIPMWHRKDVYYLSDRGPAHRLNIWTFDAESGTHRQITFYEDFDVKWPSIGPGANGEGEIVFQNNSGLHLLDLATEKAREVKVEVPGARDSLRPESVDFSSYLRNAGISPSGKRVVVEARGEIWTLPAENGLPRNLTQTNGVAERDPAWSPDGRWIAYFSDATGEYEIYLTQSDGKGETRQLTEDGRGYRYNPTWSPDSKKIAYSDLTGSIHIYDIESSESTFVAKDETSEWGVAVNWAPDSRWLTFAHTGLDSRQSSIKIYDLENMKLTQVTSDMFSDGSPVFDRQGDWLYFTSGRNFNNLSMSSIDSNYIHENVGVLLAVPLRSDVEYPWTPKSDEETWSEEKEETEDAEDAEESSEDEDEPAPADANPAGDQTPDDGVTGVWSGSFAIPGMGEMPFTMTITLSGNQINGSVESGMGTATVSGTYDKATGQCQGTFLTSEGESLSFSGTLSSGSLNWVVSSPEGDVNVEASRDSGGDAGSEPSDDGAKKTKKGKPKVVKKVEIEFEGFERRAIQLPVAAGSFGNLRVNDKNQLLYARRGQNGGIKLFDLKDDKRIEKTVTGGGGFTLSADGKKMLILRGRSPAIGNASAGSSPKNVVTDGMDFPIDPREEWPQLFTDAWRLFRDYFYAENMHGVDWKGIHDHYRPMIDACVTRNDVDYVIREVIAELNCGHTYFRGGPLERASSVGVGLLGCDFSFENGAYRIAGIVEGGVWDADVRGPLSQPGVDVKAGDYLLAVNGETMDVTRDPWAAFVGLSGKGVELTVSDKPTLDDDARRVWVKTIGSESNLRYRAWIEKNRAYVAEVTGGKVGYIYVPDTGANGRNNFFRQLYGQTHLSALIVDERWNGGGWFPNREIEALDRPITNYWARRHGRAMATPADAHQGPKCMLINRDSGSGGDMFPYLFKQAGLGKLIGTRTWGGLVGYSGSPSLIDGATLSIPSFGFYERDGTWGVEGHGVDPDIEVLDDPAMMQDGADPQLDTAIRVMLSELATDAFQAPPEPADPDRRGMGLPEADRNQFPKGND